MSRSTSPRIRGLLYAALAALLLLHNDLWFWDDRRLVLGLPVGLTYHVFYCIAAAILMALLVRFAWPVAVDLPDDEGRG